jgi:hypothetical protein
MSLGSLVEQVVAEWREQLLASGRLHFWGVGDGPAQLGPWLLP